MHALEGFPRGRNSLAQGVRIFLHDAGAQNPESRRRLDMETARIVRETANRSEDRWERRITVPAGGAEASR
jgi:hypothetical protein